MASPQPKGDSKASVPTGLWKKCEQCGTASLADEVAKAMETCPACGHHFRIGGRDRLLGFLDPQSMIEIARELQASDPLGFRDSKRYLDRIKATVKSCGEEEAFLLAEGRLRGRPVIAGAFEFKFMGGSMGSVVGDKVTLAFELGIDQRRPVIIFSSSGGARMQEG